MRDGPYVFVDVETTGASATRGRVIEVAAIRYEDDRIVDEFHSPINPETYIPYFITNITGITSSDVADAPAFSEVADSLSKVLDGAVFVAHNVRFDYSFLKQEFIRIGQKFSPKLLCTVRLSRALYPEQQRHRLSDLIERHGLSFDARHRAYDDAYALVQFWQKIQLDHQAEVIEQAITRQLKRPSIPRHLDQAVVDSLPQTPGVYIFRDESGMPLYIGKSINIRKRVLSHFTRDTVESKEFKISQSVRNIDFEETGTELAALLRESHLVKTYLPLYNRKLRRLRKLVILERSVNSEGYYEIIKRELAPEDLADMTNVLAIFERRSGALAALEQAVAVYNLCSKLCGLEKSTSACFRYQLGKCNGACIGSESADSYNSRLMTVFKDRSISSWPYDNPIIISERSSGTVNQAFIVDQWIVRATITQSDGNDPIYVPYSDTFDHDSYLILRAFLIGKPSRLDIRPYDGEYDNQL